MFYVSTDQDGNFRVGEYFRIDQATGRATLNANAFDLAGLTSLKLGSIGAQLGETINEFSSDATMSGNSNTAVPTEYAVKTYADTKVAKAGSTMTGPLVLSANPTSGLQAATKQYVDGGGDVLPFTDAATYNATTGRLATFADYGSKIFQNVVYSEIGFLRKQTVISSYQEVVGGVTKTVTLTYNDDATIKTITVV